MRLSFFIFLCVICLKVLGSCSLESRIQELIDSVDPYCDVGMDIQTLEGKEILSRNNHRSYATASTQKILSTAVALAISKNPEAFEEIDKRFSEKPFITFLYFDPNARKSYLVFGGDPLFKTQDLEFMLREAKTKGLLGKELVLVLAGHSSDSLPHLSPGVPYESLDFCYGATLLPTIIDGNQISFQLSGKASCDQASIELEKTGTFFPVRNQTFLRDRCFEEEIDDSEQIQRRALSFDGDKIHVTGCIPKSTDFKMCIPIPLQHLPIYLKKTVQQVLVKNHLRIPVKISSTYPKNLKALKRIEYSSSSLKKLLEVSLKDSNNLVTDALFEKITKKKAWPRNWVFAGRVLKEHLVRLFEVNFSEGDDIESGSGLSAYNRLTPLTLTNVLRKIYQKFGEEFALLLAEGGVDGTLKDRFKDLAYGKIRAKTGTLRGVTALAGYLYGKSQSPYVMTIVVTGAKAKQKAHRQLIDGIVKILLEELIRDYE